MRKWINKVLHLFGYHLAHDPRRRKKKVVNDNILNDNQMELSILSLEEEVEKVLSTQKERVKDGKK